MTDPANLPPDTHTETARRILTLVGCTQANGGVFDDDLKAVAAILRETYALGPDAATPSSGEQKTGCRHMDFFASVGVARLEDSGGFITEIRVHCKDCGTPFQFLGLEPGMDTQGARVSIDGLEANIAICPKGERPSPLQRIIYNVGKFDA